MPPAALRSSSSKSNTAIFTGPGSAARDGWMAAVRIMVTPATNARWASAQRRVVSHDCHMDRPPRRCDVRARCLRVRALRENGKLPARAWANCPQGLLAAFRRRQHRLDQPVPQAEIKQLDVGRCPELRLNGVVAVGDGPAA